MKFRKTRTLEKEIEGLKNMLVYSERKLAFMEQRIIRMDDYIEKLDARICELEEKK